MSYTGAQLTTATFPTDNFVGDGTTRIFTLNYNASSASSVLVSINSLHAYISTYSVNGTNIIFVTAPANGALIEIVYLGIPRISQNLQNVTSVGLNTSLPGLKVTNSPVISAGTMNLGVDPAFNGLGVAGGGTGQNTLPINQLLIGNATNNIISLSSGADGQLLRSTGTSTLPIWQNNIVSWSGGTTGLTPATASVNNVVLGGILNVTNGGTGFSTLPQNSILLGNGTNPLAIVTGFAGVGTVLTTLALNAAPQWADGTRVAQITTTLSGITLTSSTFTPPVGVAGNPLSSSVAIAGTLGAANGGTGLSTLPINQLLAGNATNAVISLTSGIAGQVLTSAGAGILPSWAIPNIIVGASISSLVVGNIILGFMTGPTFPLAYGTSVVVNGTTTTLVSAGVNAPNGTYQSLGAGASSSTLSLWVRVA